MSWYKRKPKVREQPKHLPHRVSSPIADRMMEAAKKTGPSKNLQDKSDSLTNK